MKFTIFTGCYNSSPYISRVFESINSQVHKDFEWIVIDDCSKDNTVDLLKDFIENNPQLDIKLIINEKNRGVSINRHSAIQLAKGDLFVTWDHDDVAKAKQLYTLNEVWLSHGNDTIANIYSMCENQFGKLYGSNFPEGVTVGNYLDYYKQYFMGGKVSQERHVCSRVAVLREFIIHHFPEGDRTPDGDTLWGLIALQYNSIMLNEALRIYYNDPGNVHNMSTFTRSQKANVIYTTKLIWVNHFIQKMKKDPLLQMRFLFAVTFYGFISHKALPAMIKDVNFWFSKFMLVVLALPAKALIKYMRLKGEGL